MAVHFVGFRDDRFWNAVAVFGWPDFYHRSWDYRAAQEIAECDIVVFARAGEKDHPSEYSFNDSEVF